MTVKDLMSEVAALGFESEIEPDIAFTSAATRAIRHIFTDRAVTKNLRLFPRAVGSTFYIERLTHNAGKDISLLLEGRAYSFKLSGCGSFTVGTEVHPFDTDGAVFRGFCNMGDSLTFSGDFLYTVYDFSVFSERVSDNISDIPIKGEPIVYDMMKLTDDFLAFSGPIRDGRGRSINGARFEGSLVYLPEGTSGAVVVNYRRAPRAITGFDTSEEIDIPTEAMALLPLLTASYLWLDDDQAKAEYYMQLYQAEISSLRRYISPSQSSAYEIPNRWA